MDFEVNKTELLNGADSFDLYADRVKSIADSFNTTMQNLSREVSLRLSLLNNRTMMNARIRTSTADCSNLSNALRNAANLYFNAEGKVTGSFSGSASEKREVYVKGATEEEVNAVIDDFERQHPQEAARIEEILRGGKNNQITDEDIKKIKYLIYTAEEPYRSIYLNSLSKLKIGNADLNGGAYYKPFFHTLNYSYPECFADDPRGPYTTFFHESGHAIDDLSEVSKWLGSDTENFKAYSGAFGREITLREAIEYDVYYNTNNSHSITSLANEIIESGKSGSRGNVDNVINAFRSGSPDGLSNDDLKLYNAVKNQYLRTTGSDASFEAVSDVYGGVSGNELRTNYGHDASYWNDSTKAGKELWAEYFSYNMAGDQANLENLVEYFPEASKVLDEYASRLVQK